MALRLSSTSGAALSSPEDAPVLAALSRAADALGRHDLAAWAATFSAAGELPGQAGFEARIRLVEAALRDPAPTSGDPSPVPSPGRTAERLHAVAVALVGVLEAGPHEPVLLNQAGVVLSELGALDAAEALFRA
ncbi:MAG: hypothetical protein F2817_17700, partial [Actinobacteria bacterium]|nr:hypothetical protein [Actinomycetota bacterium]